MSLSRFAALAGLLALCAIAAARAHLPIANPDLGWHLALGEWIRAHGEIPDREPFTHTARGAPMVAHEWLSQWGYATVVAKTGLSGLRALHAALAAALVALLYAFARRAGASAALALAGAALWLALAHNRLQVRPHMLNPLFAMIGYGVLGALRPRLDARQLLAAFAFVALWANLHSGAVLALAVTGLHAAAATFGQRVLGRAPRSQELGGDRIARLWALVGVTALALVCTPHHLHLVPYLLESSRINAALSLEWQSLAGAPGLGVSAWLAWAALAVATLGTAAARWRGGGGENRAAVAIALLALPFASGRRFSWTVFAPILFLASDLPRAWPAARSPRFAAAALVLCASLLAAQLPWRRMAAEQGEDLLPAMFPVQAMDLLERVELEGRLFASNKWGGYVLYRTHDRYPVFVDGRWITIGERVIRDAHTIANRLQGTRALLDAYGIELLLVHREWMTEEVRRNGGWIPAFENYNSGLYLRPGPARAGNLERLAEFYRAQGVPFDPTVGFDEQRVAAASPAWAERYRVQRFHLDQFGDHGRRATGRSRLVPGW